MVQDGIKAKEKQDEVMAFDLAELVLTHLEKSNA